jgi:ergothioneine biosynthesis protein EgtB
MGTNINLVLYPFFLLMTFLIDELIVQFLTTRKRTEDQCLPLAIEDYVPQPILDVSPPKWHLAHTTWFFEQFVLLEFLPNYLVFQPEYLVYFNSYYQNAGERIPRDQRGNLSRPLVQEIMNYRHYVTHAVELLLQNNHDPELLAVIELGIHHEMQHQELLIYDIKYILGSQPAQPVYGNSFELEEEPYLTDFITINEGLYSIGAHENHFAYDNEKCNHRVWIDEFSISNRLVTNGEFLEFIHAGGYEDFNFWHDEGWTLLQSQKWQAPLYWKKLEGEWGYYTLTGFKKLDKNLPVQHLSFYEASAFAAWKNCRLPTEQEWEVAADHFSWGKLWEWTSSAYMPYPGFVKADGALGEYNGKFMVNQQVLRGASVATPKGHSRKTYRNFFAPHTRWHFSGLRLVK